MCTPAFFNLFNLDPCNSTYQPQVVRTVTPMDLVVKIFFTVFPPAAAFVSGGLFLLTGNPIAFLSTLGFGVWSLVSLISSCPDCDSPPRRRSRDIYNIGSSRLPQPHHTTEIHYHPEPQPRYNQ